MFAMGMTRQRQAEREKRVHKAAIKRALVRQLQREEIKQGLNGEGEMENGVILSDEDDLSDIKSTSTTQTTFYDLCNETKRRSEEEKNGKGKPGKTTDSMSKAKESADEGRKKKKSKKSSLKKRKTKTTKEDQNKLDADDDQLVNDVEKLKVEA